MAYYEHVMLLRPDVHQNQIDELVEKSNKIIQKYSGQITKTEDWGLRYLAYKITKNKKSRYLMLELDVPHEGLKELQRIHKIDPIVIRTMAVKIDQLDPNHSSLSLAYKEPTDNNA